MRGAWSAAERRLLLEADRWALDAGDVLRWLESAASGTAGVVRLAVET